MMQLQGATRIPVVTLEDPSIGHLFQTARVGLSGMARGQTRTLRRIRGVLSHVLPVIMVNDD